ncbi:MAG: TetR/AcrR family transcriptional regulator [Solirubrobacteraceae bacterium]|nr:TetR/AcrR family transcriptional regulator [Solirubrobacteraceae bacterium]
MAMSPLADRDPWPAPVGKRARTRRTLILAADEVFSRKSVERAKIEEIAALADVSVGTIYSHFGSKDGLAVAYLDAIFDLLDRDLEQVRSEPSPIRRVLAAGDVYVQHVIDFPVASRMASVRAAYPPAEHMDEAAQKLDRRMVTTLMGVAADLKESMDGGEIPQSPIDEVMVFVWGAWHGVATSVARCDHLAIPPETAQRALRRGRQMLLGALGADPAPAELLEPTHQRKA